MFDDYLYISSLSSTLVQHLRGLAQSVTQRYGLGETDLVVDIGSNDGTLLKGFKELGVRTLGVDPAKNLASLASENGIESLTAYFDEKSSDQITEQYGQASAVTATNVFPHIQDFTGFLKGLDSLLTPDGVFVLEAHYLGDLIEQCAFDTVYHEHVSFWSLGAATTLFGRFGFEVVDVERLPIHHGQIRIYVQRAGRTDPSKNVSALLADETSKGLTDLQNLEAFSDRVGEIRTSLGQAFTKFASEGKSVVGYGAPAKGNTLLTYLGVGPEQLPYIADKSPLKQGRFTPGTHIPVVEPAKILSEQPDYVLILAWNFADEIMQELSSYREAGGKFILPVPKVKVI